MKHQKLKVSFFGYVVVLTFLGVLQFIAVYLFTQGFLLKRNVLPYIAECEGTGLGRTCFDAPKFDKAVVLVIDALRFDFVIPVDENPNPYYHNNLPVLHELAEKHPKKSVLLKFLADPPTTTLQRLKGLTTGSLPTFIDAGSNFNGDAIDEDNWILQLHKHNKSVAFMGDDTWTALFSEYINPKLNYPYDSLNVWDLHTVDNGVIDHLFPILDSPGWDVAIGHFLGVDHAGHRYGPNHYAMREKLQQMDQVIRDVVAKIDDKTLLIVMGDHGMDKTGNHGGDSADELESTLFFYSKNKKFNVNRKSRDQYVLANRGEQYRAVNQIDLVPTISLLMGLPIPYNNLGFPVDEVFGSENELARASYLTVQQIMRYRNLSKEVQGDPRSSEKYHHIVKQFADMPSTTNLVDMIAECKTFQLAFLEHCKGLWARFDMVLIALGIAVLLLSLSVVVTYSRSIPSVRVLTMSFEFIGSVIAMSLLGVVLSLSMFVVLRPASISLKTVLLCGVSMGITVGFWAPIMDRFSVVWLGHQVFDFFVFNLNSWSTLGLVFTVLHCLIFASNSYVVWEDKMVHFFVSTFGFCCLYGSLTSAKPKAMRIMGVMHSLTFIILSRLIMTINLCREEQAAYCIPTFKVSWWNIVLLHASALVLPKVVKAFYQFTSSYHSAAPLWIETGMTFMMFMNAMYWTLEYVENNGTLQNVSRGWLSAGLLKSLKLAIARIVLVISLVLANFSWSRGPLCVKIELSKDEVASENSEDGDSTDENSTPVPQPQPKPSVSILGYGNVYGSSYFLLIINVAIACLLVTKPLGALSICVLIVQLLSLLELFDLLDLRRNLVAPVVFGLLGYQHFFTTGHQATIPSIQWEVGFMTTQTIFFPFTHLNIALNTFGSFFIVCLSVPLITLWRLPPSSKPITVLSQIVTNVTTLLTYQTLTSIMSFIFAAHFRRHLMVWKIFAPRFMLSALLIVVFNVTLTLGTMWFATGRVLTQINRIFGK